MRHFSPSLLVTCCICSASAKPPLSRFLAGLRTNAHHSSVQNDGSMILLIKQGCFVVSGSHLRSLPLSSSLLRLCFLSLDLLLLLVLRFELLCRSLDLDLLLAMLLLRSCVS